jgi:hypothetical protein
MLTFWIEVQQRGTRDDQELIDYLVQERIPYVDINAILFQDYKHSNLSETEYLKPYFVNGAGHLNPMGNHFVAYSIKDKVVELLEPKPLPYQEPGERRINFEGYLRGGVYH